MNDQLLHYKNYYGSVDFDLESKCLYGKVLHIKDLVTYEAKGIEELETAFRESVDDYLLTCEELGIDPQKGYKGSLNVRLGPDLHRTAAIQATLAGSSLNDFIKCAVEEKVSLAEKVQRHVHEHKFVQEVVAGQSAGRKIEFGTIEENFFYKSLPENNTLNN